MRLVFICIILSIVDGEGHNGTSTSELVDFIREVVWGGASGGRAYGQKNIHRAAGIGNLPPPGVLSSSPSYETLPVVTSVIGGDVRLKARQLMREVEVDSDGRTLNSDGESNGVCYCGVCCGWGHRLMREVMCS